MGARMTVLSRLNLAATTALSSAFTVASAAEAVARNWSACSCVTYSFRSSESYRATSRRALAAVALSRASAARACRYAARYGRASIRNSTSPRATSCPSRNATWVMMPSTWGATVAVSSGVTIPFAATVYGTLARRAAATLTGTGAPADLPCFGAQPAASRSRPPVMRVEEGKWVDRQ
jgi:hypothetical protein